MGRGMSKEKGQGRDITGNKYNRLTAIKFSHFGESKYKSRYWLFKCDCGKEKAIGKEYVTGGYTKSCGCLFLEVKTTHGSTRNRTLTGAYLSWQSLKRRCLNKHEVVYQNYGARGIKVCNRWKKSFANFLEDMGERPSREYQLDRINNNGNYEPNNCKWSTKKEQANNRRTTILINYNGETKCLMDWCKKYDLAYSTMCYRRRVNPEWSLEQEILHKQSLTYHILYIIGAVNPYKQRN